MSREKRIRITQESGRKMCIERTELNTQEICKVADDAQRVDFGNVDARTDIVSIRCRKHKRRFNVEKEWVGTSRWLCPGCYYRMTEAERAKYAPCGEEAEVREAEIGKPVVYAKVEEEKARANARVRDHKENNGKVKAQPIKKKVGTNVSRVSERLRRGSDSISSGKNWVGINLVGLLPKWRMICQKCGREAPVHKSYIESISSVVCPECSSKMNESEIKDFNSHHQSTASSVWRVESDPVTKAHSLPKAVERFIPIYSLDDASAIASGGCYSNGRIMQMSEAELTEAVRFGKISKARARIELNRRKNTEYYGGMPDIDPVKIVLPR